MNCVNGEVPESREGGTPIKQIPEELLDQLLEGYEKPEDLLGRKGHWTSIGRTASISMDWPQATRSPRPSRATNEARFGVI